MNSTNGATTAPLNQMTIRCQSDGDPSPWVTRSAMSASSAATVGSTRCSGSRTTSVVTIPTPMSNPMTV